MKFIKKFLLVFSLLCLSFCGTKYGSGKYENHSSVEQQGSYYGNSTFSTNVPVFNVSIPGIEGVNQTDSPEEEKESNLRNDFVYNQGGSSENKKTQHITINSTTTTYEIPGHQDASQERGGYTKISNKNRQYIVKKEYTNSYYVLNTINNEKSNETFPTRETAQNYADTLNQPRDPNPNRPANARSVKNS